MGGESTGKTTLGLALAQTLETSADSNAYAGALAARGEKVLLFGDDNDRPLSRPDASEAPNTS